MKALVAALLLSTSVAQAATYYRDRFIPAGAPCMINFGGRDINAVMIQDVAIGTWNIFQKNPQTGMLASNWVEVPVKALRVTLVNAQHFQVTEEPLEPKKAALLAAIAACSKPTQTMKIDEK